MKRFMLRLTVLLVVFGVTLRLEASPFTLTEVVTTGDTIGGKTLTLMLAPSLNNSGDVAFAGVFSGGRGIFTQNTLIAATGDTIAGRTLSSTGYHPSINDSGAVAFRGFDAGGPGPSPGSFRNSLFIDDSLVVSTDDIIDGKTVGSVFFPSLNNFSTVAFRGSAGNKNAVFTQDSLIAVVGDVIAGKTVNGIFSAPPSLNDLGDVAWTGTFDIPGSSHSVFINNVLVVTEGDTIDGRTLTGLGSGSGSVSLNNSDVVAFTAIFSGGAGIFTQDSIIVATGDTINGKTLIGLGSGFDDAVNPVLNDSGDVAFLGQFSDGSVSIIVGRSQPQLRIDIDIKPGSNRNSINIKSRGTIPVAILSTVDFNATRVDEDSLTFGLTGDEDSLAFCTMSNEDVNDDGLDDVVCQFNPQDTGFQCGDAEGSLRGQPERAA